MKVRADILRIYQSLHTWTGITAGLLLFIGFYAGSLTMFKAELQQWIAPPAVAIPQVQQTALPSADWQVLLDKALATYPTELAKGFDIDLTSRSPVLSWYSQGSARDLHMDNKIIALRLDQQGAIAVSENYENKFADLIDYLHRSAGIGGEIGHDQAGVYLLGIAAVAYFLALVSGIVVLLPTLLKSFFALRKDKGASRFWLDSHNLVGVASLPFHFIIAWTVVGFAFHDLIYDGLSVFYGEQPVFQRPAANSQTYDLENLPALEQHLAAASQYSPSHKPVKLSFMRLNNTAPVAIIQMINPDGMVRGPEADYLFMQPYTLDILPFSFSTQDGASYSKFVMGLFALHYGTFAGDFGRWGYFVMGLLGAFLFYSGNLLWLHKRMKKQGGPSRSCTLMAALTIGVCLGSMLAVALTMLLGKLLLPVLDNANYAYLYCYYISFFACICYSFWRGAALAAWHGLLGLSYCCAALPLATLYLQWYRADWYSTAATAAVDLMALLFAAVFFYAARRCKKRMLNSESSSVWSLQPEKLQCSTSDI
ncbi:PepSY domain-containing protein [Rheinheimera muenzenbergensis]|uniref:PepSY domain-containing protein n=1 Tax=Rheinheimera muenzenbergensis TaxID=1193628 RepID=A0ABU8C4I8_9GAMM